MALLRRLSSKRLVGYRELSVFGGRLPRRTVNNVDMENEPGEEDAPLSVEQMIADEEAGGPIQSMFTENMGDEVEGVNPKRRQYHRMRGISMCSDKETFVIKGEVESDPITAPSGNRTTCKVLVDLDVVAFGFDAEKLMRYRRGDSLYISGNLRSWVRDSKTEPEEVGSVGWQQIREKPTRDLFPRPHLQFTGRVKAKPSILTSPNYPQISCNSVSWANGVSAMTDEYTELLKPSDIISLGSWKLEVHWKFMKHGMSVDEIVEERKKRKIKRTTVVSYLATCASYGMEMDWPRLLEDSNINKPDYLTLKELKAAIKQSENEYNSDIMRYLPISKLTGDVGGQRATSVAYSQVDVVKAYFKQGGHGGDVFDDADHPLEAGGGEADQSSVNENIEDARDQIEADRVGQHFEASLDQIEEVGIGRKFLGANIV